MSFFRSVLQAPFQRRKERKGVVAMIVVDPPLILAPCQFCRTCMGDLEKTMIADALNAKECPGQAAKLRGPAPY